MELPKRKPNRLAGYDYDRPGGYFVTICTRNRCPVLRRGAHCAPENEFPPLTREGRIVETAIQKIEEYHPGVFVDKYVVMPNHVHLLLRIEGNGRRTLCAPTAKPLVGRVVWGFKQSATKQIGRSIWQKGYHDHVIRGEEDYLRIWEYVDTNPAKWREDRYYVERDQTEKGDAL